MSISMKYDKTDLNSIIKYAHKLIGKNIFEILSESPYSNSIKLKDKGGVGKIIEKHWFDIEPNNSPEPDFEEVGVELKIIPLIKQKTKIAVKERTKICSINYKELILEDWCNSHAKRKLNKVLFVYYLYDKENIQNSEIKQIDLWELAQGNNELIIQSDWLNVKNKVKDGFAHELSETLSKVLAAARSGSGGKDKNGKLKDLVIQPNQKYKKEALKRAFALKQSFTNQRWLEISTKAKYESIIESLNIKSIEEFESSVLNKINKYQNKTIDELSNIFKVKIPNGKNRVATIIKKAIGFKNVNSKIKEFEQLGISVKTIKVRRRDNKPLEAISFPTMRLKEFVKENALIDSTFYEYISKILFIPVYYDNDSLNSQHIGKAFFWEASIDEFNQIECEWENYRQEVLAGKCKVTKIPQNSKKGYKEVSSLSKESETSIIHMRPHGKDSTDRDEDEYGNSIVKQCFWLNKDFVQGLLNKSQ